MLDQPRGIILQGKCAYEPLPEQTFIGLKTPLPLFGSYPYIVFIIESLDEKNQTLVVAPKFQMNLTSNIGGTPISLSSLISKARIQVSSLDQQQRFLHDDREANDPEFKSLCDLYTKGEHGNAVRLGLNVCYADGLIRFQLGFESVHEF
jgi:hypothetical protein